MHSSITKPRYSLIIYWIKRLFQSNNINTFPFQVRQLLKNYDVKIFRYSTLADNYNCAVDSIVDIIGSEDGETFYLPENELYMVTYNDACLSKKEKIVNFLLFQTSLSEPHIGQYLLFLMVNV